LVDANVPMYAAGAEHAYKAPAGRFLGRVANGDVEAVVGAEVLQEILHRYRALDRWPDGRRVFDLTRTIFPVVLPVTAEIVDRARSLLDQHPTLVARDALHASVVLVNGLDAICSFDRDFDAISGLRRLDPGVAPA
jgi:predicted nucleic acid-binding protein